MTDLGPEVECVKISQVDAEKSKPNAECGFGSKESYHCGFFSSVPEIFVTTNNVFMCMKCLEKAFPGISKQISR